MTDNHASRRAPASNPPDHFADAGKMVPASPSPGLRDVLAEFEKRTKAVPVGHEIPSRGSSTYNWRMCHLDELREIASALAAKEGA